jgi:hypothetical protein
MCENMYIYRSVGDDEQHIFASLSLDFFFICLYPFFLWGGLFIFKSFCIEHAQQDIDTYRLNNDKSDGQLVNRIT